MEVVSLNREPNFEEESHHDSYGDMELQDDTAVKASKKDAPLPTVGLEFDSFDGAYDFYNMYAIKQGFGIRVGNSWFRSKQKERYRAKFSCSNAGFKRKMEANNPRPETRTGCPAMLIVRLVGSKRWRIVEVELQHNHIFSSEMKHVYKSHKKIVLAAKDEKKNDPAMENASSICTETSQRMQSFSCPQILILERTEAIRNTLNIWSFKMEMHLLCTTSFDGSRFFYLMDHDDEGHLKNIFWADSKSRVAYEYYCDVISVETTCMANAYGLNLISFVGVNNHGNSILLGCSLVASLLVETLFGCSEQGLLVCYNSLHN
ncbi:hypothetical protein QQ045_017883 [Rhodiola kirilowii]